MSRTVTSYKSYPANIEGVVNSEVRAKVSGYITNVLVDAGQPVKRGQLLFRLETQSLNQEAAAGKANVYAAQVEVDKLKPLVEKDIISNVQLETAKARLEQAKSTYNSVTANIGYAEIRSPVDGILGSINFRKGALISPQDQLPLTRVSTIENVYAYFAMNEKDFLSFITATAGSSMEAKIKNLPKVKLILANGQEYETEGTIETISGDIDPGTGTVTFRAIFANPAGLLRKGSSGTITVPQVFEDALIVPALSTYEQQGKTFVYTVQGDSLVASALTILSQTGNMYVVSDGVEAGTLILAKGANKVKPGTKIIPEEVAMDSILTSFNTVFK
jgi:membrane fusion protein (multidrug efflux system)